MSWLSRLMVCLSLVVLVTAKVGQTEEHKVANDQEIQELLDALKSPLAQKAITKYRKDIEESKRNFSKYQQNTQRDFQKEIKKYGAELVDSLEQARKEAMKADKLDEAIAIRDARKYLDLETFVIVPPEFDVSDLEDQIAESKAEIARLRRERKEGLKLQSQLLHIPPNAVLHNGHLYFVSEGPATWRQAKEQCEQMGGHLVRIEDASENSFVKQLLANGKVRDYWIDGSDEQDEGHWQFTDGRPMLFAEWARGEPNNGARIEHHILIGWPERGRKWGDFGAGMRIGFVCEWDIDEKRARAHNRRLGKGVTKADVKIPAQAVEFGGHHYFLFNRTVTWHMAMQACENLGGHLVRIETPDENQFVKQLAKQGSRSEGCWIDGSDEAKEGVWRFSDGRRMVYTSWPHGEPNNVGTGEHHVALLKIADWNWTDANSSTRGAFICEWDRSSIWRDGSTVLAPPEGFVSLFNGRDLTGWTYDDSGHWGVEEGLLTYDGGDGNPIRTPTTSATSGPKRSSGTSSF